MGALIFLLATIAAIIACVVYVWLRDRRGSGEHVRFEPTQQGAPYPEKSDVNERINPDGIWTGSGSV
jgi:hypothetical protein